MDRKIKKLGNDDIDPNAPKDKPMPLDASVEVDDELPKGVPYEILSHLHLPNDYGDYEFIESGHRQFSNFIESLVDESLRLTDNWEDMVTPAENARSRKWTPSGTIKTYDSSEGSNIPVEGLKVRARRWFTTHTGMTNSSGYYRCDGSFRRPANYSLKFERHDFQIRTSTWLFNSAGVNGPKIERSWNPIFLSTKPESYDATIFRAAHHYYYKYIYGLNRPPQNNIWKTQLKLKAFFGSRGFQNGQFEGFPLRGFGLYSPIHIYRSNRLSVKIYATTIHELAHAAHWCQGKGIFNDSEVKVKQSWARGVEWFLTKTVYDG
ncbi:MAG: carboxypeptidase-like regulatory domain-containing protein, partial [Flavobacteriaceae bacterium]|nr:carboxypeptidase-like regulatory domain-containing protein [Flavobacteriaceae bacterium]